MAVAALAAGTTGYLAAVDPNRAGHYPLCPFRYLTGYACPGCGTLRAVHDLAHGELSAALARNPLFVLAVPVLLWAWLDWTCWTWTGRHLTGRHRLGPVPPWVSWGLPVLVVAFWVLRNLPGFGGLGP